MCLVTLETDTYTNWVMKLLGIKKKETRIICMFIENESGEKTRIEPGCVCPFGDESGRILYERCDEGEDQIDLHAIEPDGEEET